MNDKSIAIRIVELEEEIESLPQGTIGKKNVKGNIYYYHRYYKNGKKVEKYLGNAIVSEFKEKIERRKKLENELKELKKQMINNGVKNKTNIFLTNIRIGKNLYNFVNPVRKYQKRECFKTIIEFIYDDLYDKVLILYGLRRTGKTTLIRQVIADMTDRNFNKTAFIQVAPSDNFADLNKDLKKLESLGYQYIFIDEATLMSDFIEGAALFSDIYAASGMKIVLSGTDSLGFMFTKSEQLYDRCILLHTTFIPYREFKKVLGKSGIDDYIRYGGTMSLTGVNYNQEYIFNDAKNVNEYVDTAIAQNIQHSLKYYHDGNHFRHLQELFESNELTNVINRVVEDINHRFTLEVLTKEFKSNDLALSARNLRKDIHNPSTILDDIDKDKFTKHLKEILQILDIYEQSVELNKVHALEIKEYLHLLDLIYEIDVKSFPNVDDIKQNIVIAQPGLRYAQATALIDSLLLDQHFKELSIKEKNYITTRILNEIKGRMMEDIILLETKLIYPEKEVFKLQFVIGEFDMVIFDPISISCEIFEIKHSKESVSNQYRFLIDEEKLKQTEFRYGDIKRKCIIYNGETHIDNGIEYINADEYLMFENK